MTLFRLYAVLATISLIGSRMQRLVLAWQVWELTHSGAWLGALASAELLPILVFGPFSGSLIDKYGSNSILIISSLVSAVQTSALIICDMTIGLGAISIIALTTLFGLSSAFQAPADLAMISVIVQKSGYRSAVVINSVLSNLSVSCGPLIGGLAIDNLGFRQSLYINLFSFILFLLLLVLIFFLFGNRRRSAKTVDKTNFLSGLSYLNKDKSIASMVMSCFCVSVFGRYFIQIMPTYSAGFLGGGAALLSYSLASIGAGATLGSLSIFRIKNTAILHRIIVFTMPITAIVMCSMPFFGNCQVALVAMFTLGGSLGINGAGTQTFVQLEVDDHYRGRVLSIFSTLNRGGIALGSFIFGTISSFLSMKYSLFISGISCLGGCIVMSLINVGVAGKSKPSGVHSE